MSARLFLLTTFLTFFLINASGVFGQISPAAYNLEISDSNAEAGQIVASESGKYRLTSQEYDPGIYGVIVTQAPVVLNIPTATTKIVVTTGEALVKVNKNNGDIKTGDLITSSKDKGIGQKATKSGHILGKALANFPSESQSAEVGTIPVLISVNFNQFSSRSEELSQAGVDQVASKITGAFLEGNFPSLIKYIFALLLGGISFFVGLAHFVRSNRSAVDAIARNPLAKGDIQKQLIIGTAGILAISAVGLGIAVAILVFF